MLGATVYGAVLAAPRCWRRWSPAGAALPQHPRHHGQGRRILTLEGPWGSVRVDAEHKHGLLTLHEARSRFIFADIAGAEPGGADGKWSLALRTEHNARPLWQIPMASRKGSAALGGIFTLAAAQKL